MKADLPLELRETQGMESVLDIKEVFIVRLLIRI